MTALAAFSLNNSSCAQNQKPAVTQTDRKPNKNEQTQQIQQQTSFVAPVFIHGDGVSSYGCVMVAPPVIIFEQDAMEIIKMNLLSIIFCLKKRIKVSILK